MKFLYCSDLHGTAQNPSSRIDNYYQSWMAKIKEIVKISKETGCNYVIVGGDVFNTPHVSNTVIDDFMDIVENQDIIWYIVPGNHDEIGHNWELSKSSGLAHVFRRSKKIKMLDELLDKVKEEDKGSSYIKGIAYYHTIETDLKEKGLYTNNTHDLKIAIPHAFISLTPFFTNISHIVAKDLNTNYDWILCSHLHEYWGVKEINGVKFVNLGAIGRTSINECKNIPAVAICDTIKKSIDILYLQCAKIGNQAFDLSRYEELKEKSQSIDAFLSSLQGTEWITLDIVGQIEKLDVEKKVKDYMIERITKLKEQVK